MTTVYPGAEPARVEALVTTEVEQALRAEIERLRNELIDPAELKRIVTQAVNAGTLSAGESGEPPVNLYFTDIAVQAH